MDEQIHFVHQKGDVIAISQPVQATCQLGLCKNAIQGMVKIDAFLFL